MTIWKYRLTPAGANLETTLDLLDQYDFLHRTLHNVDQALIANVQFVRKGDFIHLYWAEGERPQLIGSCAVNRSINPLGCRPPNCAIDVLLEPRDQPLILRLQQVIGGYEVDPVVGAFTGFRVTRLNDPMIIPPQNTDFPGNSALHRLVI